MRLTNIVSVLLIIGVDGIGSTDRNGWLKDGMKNAVASGVASVCVKSVLQPFDTIKTVQQAEEKGLNVIEAGIRLVRRSGIGALYSGLAVTLIGSAASVGIYFGVYQCARDFLTDKDILPATLNIALAAGFGNLVAASFRVPYETVKQKVQAGVYPDSVSAINGIFKNSGWIGFCTPRGWISQAARDVPYAMATLLLYETLKSFTLRSKTKENARLNHLESILIGATAGGFGTLVTNPMDVVKTRVMTNDHGKYTTLLQVTQYIYTNEGIMAFWKGATPRLCHKIPANGIFFLAYEFFRKVLGVQDYKSL